MVDNQHKQIKGYRDLSETEIALMNKCKELGVLVGQAISNIEKEPNIDMRWLAIAKTDLQKGFMSLIRSIARPETF